MGAPVHQTQPLNPLLAVLIQEGAYGITAPDSQQLVKEVYTFNFWILSFFS